MGAKVVVSSRKAEGCEAVADAIRRVAAKPWSFPATSAASRRSGSNEGTLDKYGRIDALVCNDCHQSLFGAACRHRSDAFDKIMASNIKNDLWLANLTLREWPSAAAAASPSSPHRRHSRQLHARRLRHLQGRRLLAGAQPCRGVGAEDVCVNAIAPGLVKTDFARALWENPANLAKRRLTTPLQAHRRARRHRRHCCVPGLAGGSLHHGPGHRRRWWRDHRLIPVTRANGAFTLAANNKNRSERVEATGRRFMQSARCAGIVAFAAFILWCCRASRWRRVIPPSPSP